MAWLEHVTGPPRLDRERQQWIPDPCALRRGLENAAQPAHDWVIFFLERTVLTPMSKSRQPPFRLRRAGRPPSASGPRSAERLLQGPVLAQGGQAGEASVGDCVRGDQEQSGRICLDVKIKATTKEQRRTHGNDHLHADRRGPDAGHVLVPPRGAGLRLLRRRRRRDP